MFVFLTKDDAQEVRHKIGILQDEMDLQIDYNLTQDQVNILYSSIPYKKGIWYIPDFATDAVKGEMFDHIKVLTQISYDTTSKYEASKIRRQIKRFNEIFGKL